MLTIFIVRMFLTEIEIQHILLKSFFSCGGWWGCNKGAYTLKTERQDGLVFMRTLLLVQFG